MAVPDHCPFLIRRPHPYEFSSVHHLVQDVVNEVLPTMSSVLEQDWSHSWIAIMDHQIAGVVLTGGDWLDDLWVAAGYRRRGIGSALLARGELEIAERGSAFARLRVVASNRTAVSFYLRYGWQLEREFPHESLPLVMLEMRKRV